MKKYLTMKEKRELALQGKPIPICVNIKKHKNTAIDRLLGFYRIWDIPSKMKI